MIYGNGKIILFIPGFGFKHVIIFRMLIQEAFVFEHERIYRFLIATILVLQQPSL